MILGLRAHIGELEALDPGAAESLRQLYADLEAAKPAAGLIAVSVPVAFRLEDGTTGSVDALVSARDVRTLSRSCGSPAPRRSPSTGSGSSGRPR